MKLLLLFVVLFVTFIIGAVIVESFLEKAKRKRSFEKGLKEAEQLEKERRDLNRKNFIHNRRLTRFRNDDF